MGKMRNVVRRSPDTLRKLNNQERGAARLWDVMQMPVIAFFVERYAHCPVRRYDDKYFMSKR